MAWKRTDLGVFASSREYLWRLGARIWVLARLRSGASPIPFQRTLITLHGQYRSSTGGKCNLDFSIFHQGKRDEAI